MLHDYIWLILTIGFSSLLYGLKLYDNEVFKGLTKSQIFRKIIYGCGGSALTTMVVYSLCKEYGLREITSVSIGGVFGYLGAESVTGIIQKFIDKKLNG